MIILLLQELEESFSKDSDRVCAVAGWWDLIQLCAGAPVRRVQNNSLCSALASRLPIQVFS